MSDEKKIECHCCGFKTKVVEYDRSGVPHRGEKSLLCHICAYTMAGIAYDHPEQYPNEDVLRTVAYIGNMILTAIAALREPK